MDEHIWVYTRRFAHRFGMPEEWINDELKGVEAAAWRTEKLGGSTCGWGGKADACKENDSNGLTLFFDTNITALPWRAGGRTSYYTLINAVTYLVPQNCELRKRKSTSRVAMAWGEGKDPCSVAFEEQPFADPETGEDAFWFEKGITYKGQGNLVRIGSFEKESYPNLAWVRLVYTRVVGLFEPPSAAVLTLETRDAPLGKTLRKYHEITLPEDFDRRIKAILDSRREAEREFYKKSLDMK